MTNHQRLLTLLCSVALVIFIFNFVIDSQTTRKYGAYIQEITPVKLTSMTVTGYYVGRTPVQVSSDFYTRVTVIYNAGPHTVWFSPLPNATTYYSPGLPTAFPLVVGEKYYPSYDQAIYFVNSGLSVSSSSIIVLREMDKN